MDPEMAEVSRLLTSVSYRELLKMTQCLQGYIILWIFIITNIGFTSVECVYSATKETEIRSETVLAATYDMVSRPSATTTVKIGISLLAIEELDLKGQKFQTVGWITFEWGDIRLTWSPAAKDDIEEIFSAPDDIWKPEFVVANSLDDLGVITNSDLNLRVRYDGMVEWEPPMIFTTHCQVDITFYPYDKQKCSIDIAGWGYTVNEVVLDTLTSINMDDFRRHGEWEVTSTRTVNSNIIDVLADGTVRQYPQVQFWFHLKRRREYYNLNVVMPVFLTSLLVALTFIVPVECGEKLSYILTVFLSIAVLQTLVADSLPSTSITTSVLGLYLALVTVLAALGMLLTVIILILFKRGGSVKEQSCIIEVTRFAAKVTCLSSRLKAVCPEPDGKEKKDYAKSEFYMSHAQTDGNSNPDVVVTPAPAQEGKHSKSDVFCDVTWKEVATILDRFCFFVFTLITVLINLSFVIALAAGGTASDP